MPVPAPQVLPGGRLPETEHGPSRALSSRSPSPGDPAAAASPSPGRSPSSQVLLLSPAWTTPEPEMRPTGGAPPRGSDRGDRRPQLQLFTLLGFRAASAPDARATRRPWRRCGLTPFLAAGQKQEVALPVTLRHLADPRRAWWGIAGLGVAVARPLAREQQTQGRDRLTHVECLGLPLTPGKDFPWENAASCRFLLAQVCPFHPRDCCGFIQAHPGSPGWRMPRTSMSNWHPMGRMQPTRNIFAAQPM
ncbi:uncharacterized protein LOC118670350 [Myotis myotis]|uniref:uncharacterized protein LOC118670350 n=1 Tax=Myotis myotis TaxID=51298 RepID=UPI0017483432|nr:uncharacterized protein LOC118670350 [Myotis myotis]